MNAKHLKPTIVLDVDGVLLTWQAMLIPFLLSKGMPITQKLRTALLEGTLIWTDEIPEMDLKLIEEYNASIFCRELPPFERSLPEII